MAELLSGVTMSGSSMLGTGCWGTASAMVGSLCRSSGGRLDELTRRRRAGGGVPSETKRELC